MNNFIGEQYAATTIHMASERFEGDCRYFYMDDEQREHEEWLEAVMEDERYHLED